MTLYMLCRYVYYMYIERQRDTLKIYVHVGQFFSASFLFRFRCGCVKLADIKALLHHHIPIASMVMKNMKRFLVID